jgi:hypothetical protein
MDFSVFEKYGVTPANLLDSSGEAFISLRNAYVKLVTELDESKEEVEKEGDSFLSIQKSEVEKNETAVYLADEFIRQIRSLYNEVMECDETVCVLLFDRVQDFKQEILSDREYLFSVIKRNQVSETKSVSEDFEQKKEEAGQIAEAIRTAWTLGKGVVKQTATFRKGFPTKKSEAKDAKGELIPDLPKLPRTPGDSQGSGGRNAKINSLVLSWQAKGEEKAEELPAGTLLIDAAQKYVSDRASGFKVGVREIREAVEKQEKSLAGTCGSRQGFSPPR